MSIYNRVFPNVVSRFSTSQITESINFAGTFVNLDETIGQETQALYYLKRSYNGVAGLLKVAPIGGQNNPVGVTYTQGVVEPNIISVDYYVRNFDSQIAQSNFRANYAADLQEVATSVIKRGMFQSAMFGSRLAPTTGIMNDTNVQKVTAPDNIDDQTKGYSAFRTIQMEIAKISAVSTLGNYRVTHILCSRRILQALEGTMIQTSDSIIAGSALNLRQTLMQNNPSLVSIQGVIALQEYFKANEDVCVLVGTYMGAPNESGMNPTFSDSSNLPVVMATSGSLVIGTAPPTKHGDIDSNIRINVTPGVVLKPEALSMILFPHS